jgi:hypothetical protein
MRNVNYYPLAGQEGSGGGKKSLCGKCDEQFVARKIAET